MDCPIKVFEITGGSGESVKLEIAEVFGFPDGPSFRGGYDIRCNLEITAGAYTMRTDVYYTATGALYDFYTALQKCHNALNGKAKYSVYMPENDLQLEVAYDNGRVKVVGSYQDDPVIRNILSFEFTSDQSYFNEVLNDLKKIFQIFGDKKGETYKIVR